MKLQSNLFKKKNKPLRCQMSFTEVWNHLRTHSLCLKKKDYKVGGNKKEKMGVHHQKLNRDLLKTLQWLQCTGIPRLCFFKRFVKIKQSAYLTQTLPLILGLRTPSKLLITAPSRQFGTENLVNTLINWIRFHVEQTKSREFVILGFLIITSSHFFTYWPLIIEK